MDASNKFYPFRGKKSREYLAWLYLSWFSAGSDGREFFDCVDEQMRIKYRCHKNIQQSFTVCHRPMILVTFFKEKSKNFVYRNEMVQG